MSIEIITLRDEQSGATAKILAGFGFNCYQFQVPSAGPPVDVIWSPPGFETGTLRPSGGGIPILFPFPGRLRGHELEFGGATWPVGDLDDRTGNAIHGYVLNRPWQVLEQSASRVVGEFHAATMAPGVLKKWPADFRLQVAYEVSDSTLGCEITISNPDERPLPLGLGLHPYFRVPLGLGGTADHCVVTVPAAEYWEQTTMLPTGERKPAVNELAIARGLEFTQMQLDHVFGALRTEGGTCRTTIRDPGSKLTMTQTFDAFFHNCVVYNPPHREAVCVEPYSCVPDAYSLRARGIDAGLRILDPGGTLTTRVSIAVAPAGE